MTKRRERRVPRDTVIEVGRAACANALAYLEDIEALEERGRSVRAGALAVFAAEEFAKAFWSLLVAEDDSEYSWDSWWAALGGYGAHEHRLATLLALQTMTADQGGSAELLHLLGDLGAQKLFAMRNACLYVDLEDGEVFSPRQMIKAPMVLLLTRSLQRSIVLDTIIVDGLLEQLAES